MKNPISVSINRIGEFSVTPEQFDDFQCGATGTRNYEYEVSIEASEECLREPDMFVMDNLVVKDYFEKKYMVEREKCRSCEVIACDAIRHFLILLAAKGVMVRKVVVIVKGSKNSFIKAEWSANIC